MIGLSNVVYIIIAIIVGILVIIILFSLGTNPFTKESSASLCKAKIIKACAEYKISGDNKVFDNVPSTCIKDIGLCSQGINDNCINELCKI
jgi:hypothetical protein